MISEEKEKKIKAKERKKKMCNAFSLTSEMCSLHSLVHKPVHDARPVAVPVSSLCPAHLVL